MERRELGFGVGRLGRLDLKCALCVVHKGAGGRKVLWFLLEDTRMVEMMYDTVCI